MPEPEETPTPEPTPSLADAARASMEEAVAKAEGADIVPVEAKTEEQKETEEALAEALPELTDEQITALAENSKVVEAVLKGNTGKQTLDTLFKDILADHETEVISKVEKEAAQKATTATAEEALKAYEDGDPAPLAKFMYERLTVQKAEAERQTAADSVKEEAKREVLGTLDEAVEQVYGDVLNQLTPEELATISRPNFKSDTEFMAGVLGLFDRKRTELVRSEAGTKAAEDLTATAAQTAEAARAARARVGVGALPGGSGVESAGDGLGIGGLIRQGLADALAETE